MNALIKTTFAAAAVALTLGVAAPQFVTPAEAGQITGVGFGDTRLKARANATIAWVQAANESGYVTGPVDIAKAAVRTSCENVQSSNQPTVQTFSSEVTIGDPNSPWICEMRGIPLD